jgi:hypothetical protein
MKLSPLIVGTVGWLLAGAPAVHSQAAADSAAPAAPPARQLTYAEAGIRITLTALVFAPRAEAMTLTIENDRETPVHVAALYGRTASGTSQAILSDSAGHACTADPNPAGIAEIPHLSGAPKPAVTSMTAIPPRSRMNVVFRFTECHLSRAPFSFAAEFAM